MSENLPVPVDHRCRATNKRGGLCCNDRLPGSEYCKLHQPRALAAVSERAPFPELPSREELATAEGVRNLITALLAYVAENENADLPRVYAIQAYTGALLRAVDVAALEAELADARRQLAALTHARQELISALESERRRRRTPAEEELQRLRTTVDRLTRRSEELETYEARRKQTQERLDATLVEQRQARETAERTLAEKLDHLRKVHRSLCYPCSRRVRDVLGGEPEVGDPDFIERREHLGSSRWHG